jgi:hypothetical protein
MLMFCLDKFRYIHYLMEADPIVAIAKHDDLYWAIVSLNKHYGLYRSKSGHETEEAALQDLAHLVAVEVFNTTKNGNLILSK